MRQPEFNNGLLVRVEEILVPAYITNVEGVLNRIKSAMEFLRDDAEDDEDKKKAKNALKKLQRIMWGQEPAVLTIEDPEGNSAIISEKAKKVK